MNGVIYNVQISFPTVEGMVHSLLALYGELLGMQPRNIGYWKLVHADGRLPEIGFENYFDDPPPRWPDPEHPQQMHLDVEVGDLDAAEDTVLRLGAARLQDNGAFRIFADQAGHPFCLYENRAQAPFPGRLVRIVFDCYSPRALARFYEELLDMRTRVVDLPEYVLIARAENHGTEPMLAFQHAQFPSARWPDPRYPEQLHLDITIDDQSAPTKIEELGGIRLRLESRPDAIVYGDPAAHPFCVGIGPPPASH